MSSQRRGTTLRWSTFLICLFVALAWSSVPAVHAQSVLRKLGNSNAADDVMPGVVLVRFVDGQTPSPAGSLAEFEGLRALGSDLFISEIRQAFPMLEAVARKRPISASMEWLRGVYEIRYDGQFAPRTVARLLERRPEVEVAEPRFTYKITEYGEMGADTPDDPGFPDQTHLRQLRLPDAWDITKGESGSRVIAIVDDGTEWTHSDLVGNMWTNPGEIAGNNIDDDGNGFVDDIHGWNFRSDNADPVPTGDASHGTRVAGAANAVTNNGEGIAGAAWNAETMAINIECRTVPLLCYSVSGVLYAALNGADVINASFSSNSRSVVMQAAVQAALDNGALVVAAAGNYHLNSDRAPRYPSDYHQVLGVGATNKDSDRIASFSNYGRSVNVFAPGVNIDVTHRNGLYARASGTSFSTPLTSGVTALVMEQHDTWEPERIREHIRLTSDNTDASNDAAYRGLMGRGRVNAYSAVSTTTENPGVRLVSYTVEDLNSDGIFQPSEPVTITATFTNFGGSATNLSVGFTASEPTYVVWSPSSVSVGALAHGASHTGTFTFSPVASIPNNTWVSFASAITDGSFTDSPDVIPGFILNALPTFMTHRTTNLVVSIADDCNIGYRKFQGGASDGGGFRIRSNGQWYDLLYEGGLIMATAQDKMVDCIRDGNFPGQGQNEGFAPKSGTWPTLSDPGQIASMDGNVQMVESSSSTAALGLEVVLDSYTFNEAGHEEYIMLEYTIANTTSSSVSGLYFGMFLDWDLELSAAEDKSSYDAQRKFGYQESSSGTSLAAGVRLLSDEGSLLFTAIDNVADLYDGFTDAEKWSFLSGGVVSGTISDTDIALLLGAGPLSISGNNTAKVVFALVAGDSETALLVSADAAKAKYDVIFGSGGTPTTFELTASPSSVSEDAGATSVTVTATVTGGGTAAAEALIPISVAGSGTASAVDFASVSDFTLTVASGASSGEGSFMLTPVNDNTDELDETITITSSNTFVTSNAVVSLIDDDATPGIELSVGPATVSEDAGATTVTVTATKIGSASFPSDQSVPISVSGSGVTDVVDFAAVNDFTITLGVSSSSAQGTFTLTPTDDTEDEADETIAISSTHAAVLGSVTLVLTDDDDAPGIELSVSPTTVSEDAGATTVMVTATKIGSTSFPSDQSVPISVSGSGATDVVDFAAVNDFTITLGVSGSSAQGTFTLTPTDDTEDEADETIAISSTHAAVLGSVTLVLTDDDDAPGIELSVSPATVSEDAGATTVTVTATKIGSTSFPSDQLVPISVSGSGATDVVDFAAVNDFTITLGASSSSAQGTFTLTPTDDTEDEADETIAISSTHAAVLGSVTLVLTDDDDAPGIALSVSPTTVSEDAGATTVTVTATKTGSGAFVSDQLVPISVSGSGTTDVVDFAAVNDFTITLEVSSSFADGTFTLTPTNDSVDEMNETITISSTHSEVLGSTTLALTDDDDTPSIALSISPTMVSEGAGATTVTVTTTKIGSTSFSSDQSVPISVTGSGTAGVVDFAAVSDFTIALAASSTSAEGAFTLTPEDDAEVEETEVITVSSTSALVTGSVLLLLTDNDAIPDGLVLSVHPSAVNEGAGAATVIVTATVSGSGTYDAAQVLTLSVTGSGLLPAVDFADVADFDLTVDAAASSGATAFLLNPVDDHTDETDELIRVSSTHASVLDTAWVTLSDDDAPPAGVVLSALPATVDEGDGPTPIVVTAATSGATVYAVRQELMIAVTASGAAGAVDFVPVSDFTLTLVAEAAEGTASFTLTPIDDQDSESDETLTLSSDSPIVLASTTVTLTDNDSPTSTEQPEVTTGIRIAPPYPNPSTGIITFTVTVQEDVGTISLNLLNLLGQLVATPMEGMPQPGEYTIRFDGQHLPAGVYAYVLDTAMTRQSGSLILQ